MQRVTGDGGAGTRDDESTKPPHADSLRLAGQDLMLIVTIIGAV